MDEHDLDELRHELNDLRDDDETNGHAKNHEHHLYYEEPEEKKARLPSNSSNAAGVRRKGSGRGMNGHVEHEPQRRPRSRSTSRPPPIQPAASSLPNPQLLSSKPKLTITTQTLSTPKPKQPPEAKFASATVPPSQPPLQHRPPEGKEAEPNLDSVTEIALLQDNFTLLRTALEDLRMLSTVSSGSTVVA